MALCLLASISAAAAQTTTATTGAVNGTIIDNSKAVMPGVTVRLSGTSLMAARTTTTDQAGVPFFRRATG